MFKPAGIIFLLSFFSLFSMAQNARPLPFKDYFSIRNGLNNFFKAVTEKKKATVAYLGGSITYGEGWRDLVDSFLKASFPATQFHSINAGIPSLGSNAHAFRVQRDVLDSGNIDLLFVEAAVNDGGMDSTTEIRALEGIVRHVKRVNLRTDIIMMSFVDPSQISIYDENKVPIVVANHELVASHYHLPSINLSKEVHDKIRNKEFDWEHDFVNLHPSPFGHRLYFNTIRALLDTCFSKPVVAGSSKAYFKMPLPLNKSSFENGSYLAAADLAHDPDWILDKDWIPQDTLYKREGFYHVPVLIGSKPGAVLTIPFQGNAIGLGIVSGPAEGIISWSVDAQPAKPLDLFTPFSKEVHLPVYNIMAEGLPYAGHVLKLEISEEKNAKSDGHSVHIVYFLINK